MSPAGHLRAYRPPVHDPVYDAEDVIADDYDCRYFDFLEVIQSWVNKVVNSKWFGKRYDQRPVRVVWSLDVLSPDEPPRFFAFCKRRVIGVVEHNFNKVRILHELAHICTDYNAPDHGEEFCRNYLRLVKRFLGKKPHKKLKKALKEYELV